MENEERNGFSRTEGDENRNDQSSRRDGEGRGYYGSREADGERRPYRPRFNNDNYGNGEQRTYRPRYNNDEQGERRPFRPRYNNDGDGERRPFRPRYNNGGDGEQRSFRPRYNNNDEQGERRPFRPRYNNDGDGEQRPFRPRYNNNDEQGERRPFRPRYNNDGDGEQRPFRPRFNNNDEQGERRSFRPRYNNDGDGEQRPFRPRFNNNDEQGERRPFRPRYNNDEQGERRSFRPRYNNDEQGERRPFRPRYNNDEQGERRPFRPRYNNDEQGERRPFRPRYNNGGDGERRSFGPRNNNGGRKPFGQRPGAPRQQWKMAEDAKRGHRYHVDRRLFDNEVEDEVNGTNPDMQEMPEMLRLNRFVAMAGITSRREADDLIKAGKIKVNGEVITQMGVSVSRDAVVEYEGRVIKPEKKVYVLLNKPKDTVTTTDDPEGRRTVMDIVAGASQERIYPVGRLDRNTTGVLLLTNDGDMAEKLMHPKYEVRKIYHVFTDKNVSEDDLDQLIKGFELEDGPINADEVSFVDGRDHRQVGVVIHSGRNRIVRRMFEHLGYNVEKLDRVYYGGLTKLNVPRGHWRYLTDEEINKLKAGFTK